MSYVRRDFTEEIHDTLVRLISTTLPHDNYDPAYFVEVVRETLSVIKLDEMYMEYYVLFAVLTKFVKMKRMKRDVHLDRETFEKIVESIAINETSSEKIGLRDYLLKNGLGSDLKQHDDKLIAMQELYRVTMDLYDEAVEEEIKSSTYQNEINILREIYFTYRASEINNVAREILENGYKVKGFGKDHIGVKDFLDYSLRTLSELRERFETSGDSDTLVILDDESKGMELIIEANDSSKPLAEYGIPELDDETPMLSSRLVIIAANPGVGKTTVMTSMVTRLILNQKKVVVFSGENSRDQLYVKILSSWILSRYGKYYPEAVIKDMSRLKEKDKKILISYQNELSKSGLLHIKEAFAYETFREELTAVYEQTEFDAFFVDHTLSMKGSGRDGVTQTLDQLAKDAREFKKDYAVFACFLSHLSSAAKQELAEGKEFSGAVTRYSSELHAEADDILVLNTSPTLRERSQVLALVAKRRGPSVPNPIVLDVDFPCNHYEYRLESQATSRGSVEKDKAMDDLEELYGNDGDDFFDDIEDDLDITVEVTF